MQSAQKLMAGLEWSAAAGRASISTKDAFHDVSDVRPFHLPHIFSPPPGEACPVHQPSGLASAVPCVINSTTVTMPIHDATDSLDTGLGPVGATEFRTKLKSRQAVWEKAGLTHVDFNVTDKANTSACRDINAAAWAWALGRASQAAVARLHAHGRPLAFAPDVWSGIGITGPKWIHDKLQYTPSADGSVVNVAAPYFALPNKNLGDEPYVVTVGYHYCKLLSPARAMEWIYVDALRPTSTALTT